MSAVDAPPGIAFDGRAAGEFTARGASRRLAARVLVLVLAASVASLVSMVRRLPSVGGELLLAAPLVAVSVALVGYAVRRARLRIDGDGIRFGWELVGFRIGRGRISTVLAYHNAIAVGRARGTPWYLSGYDFDDFAAVPAALKRAGIDFRMVGRRAPLRALLQTYGVALDLLLVLDAVFAVLILLLAVGR